jgi:ferrochelatase
MEKLSKNSGIILINLGTPENPDKKSIRKYLKEFLSDKRVIDLPFLLRYTLLYAIILPFRTPKVCEAYKSIWNKHGSPLRYNSEQLLKKVQEKLKNTHKVAFGMRYGTPSIKDALITLKDCEKITVLPLYPQYSSAATGSSIEYILNEIATLDIIPNLKIIRDFYDNPTYIKAQAEIIKKHLKKDYHILFSYHGLPERQLKKSTCPTICETCQINKNNKSTAGCYRAQCFMTTQLLAKELNLDESNYSIGFQSRLGKTEWIKPYTDKVIEDLAKRGIKNLAIVCPSFIADCLETLEEIGIRAKHDWETLTGGNLQTIPCLNSSDSLVDLISDITNKNT